MNVSINYDNLSKEDKITLDKLIKKANAEKIKLSDIKDGDTFKIGDVEFIKFSDIDGIATAVTKDTIFNSEFGKDNNFAKSTVLKKLNDKFLPQISEMVGIENICDITTDLTTLDGLKPYNDLVSKVSLPTFDFYRANVEIFDKYKIDKWWWLATPESAKPHDNPNWIVCVAPSGHVDYYNFNYYFGVRPFLRFVSSIFVSNED